MALFYPDKLKSNNPGAYGIVDAKEVSGHRQVATRADLDKISDAVLIGDTGGSEAAVGQLWYVTEEANKGFWQLKAWGAGSKTWEKYAGEVEPLTSDDINAACK